MKQNQLSFKLELTIFLICLTITACNRNPTTPALDHSNPPVKTTGTASIPTVTLTSPSAISTATPTPTPIPSLTPTATPTATLHPMSIAALREQSFPGSHIILENELEPGSNYRRFYASYLSDGLKIYGLLTIPNGEAPPDGWPAIVFNHGYIPPEEYHTTERYIAYVDNLARSQYVVFRIDYRGHDQSEGVAKGAYGDPGYLSDVLNAFNSLKQDPLVNPQRIGMWGHSMGGYLTLRAMVVNTEIHAGVIWAGVVASYADMIALWKAPSEQVTPTPPSFARRWRQNWVEQYGSPAENPAFWNSISANSFLEDISGPLQLHHGSGDDTVPLIFSERLWQQMTDLSKPVELYIYDGDDHNLSRSFSLAMHRTIAFFDTYLKDK